MWYFLIRLCSAKLWFAKFNVIFCKANSLINEYYINANLVSNRWNKTTPCIKPKFAWKLQKFWSASGVNVKNPLLWSNLIAISARRLTFCWQTLSSFLHVSALQREHSSRISKRNSIYVVYDHVQACDRSSIDEFCFNFLICFSADSSALILISLKELVLEFFQFVWQAQKPSIVLVVIIIRLFTF